VTVDRTNDPQAVIRNLTTGVLGLDAVLGGGVPEYSFNLIAGAPGAGKTTLAQQIVFANATPERPVLYFTVLGEPTLKMLRYQRQFRFFKPELLESAVRFVNLSEEAVRGSPNYALERIVREVEQVEPQIVVVDSFRTLGQQYPAEPSDRDVDFKMGLEYFVQRLALHLTTWEITSFLVAAFDEREQENPVLTVADGILWLSQAADRNSVVRKLQVSKVRGRAFMPGLHTFRITDFGLQVFPRIPEQQAKRTASLSTRMPTGVPGLDAMMGGGIPAGDAMMVVGPAGTGKTTFATQFAAAGLARGEAGVIVVFEEYPEEYLARVEGRRDADLAASVKAGRLKVLYLRPLDLSVDETLWEILEGVREVDATWVVIDSLSGFEIALAPTFREDFRESLYRLVGALTATGVTVVMTAEVLQDQADVRFTSERVSFITDDIVAQRYVEIDGALRTVVAVVKMRGSQHCREFRFYEITPAGAVVGEPLTIYHGIITGVPVRTSDG
jgi:circadian clock protein KaiC